MKRQIALRIAADVAFLISWLAFLIAILASTLPTIVTFSQQIGAEESHRSSNASRIGLILQALGVLGLTLLAPRGGLRSGTAVSASVLALAPLSAFIFCWALWLSPRAGDHRLVTKGPYAVVRHPVYASLGLMLVATALLAASPIGALFGIVIYFAGSEMRANAEESELAARYAESYATYRRKTRWRFLPGVL